MKTRTYTTLTTRREPLMGNDYESTHSSNWPTPSVVPTGVAVFAEDIPIWRSAAQSNNVVHWSEFDRGGHFAAMEAPDLLVGNIRGFFRGLR